MNMFNDFISKEKRNYKFKIGSTIASSLTGFIFGIIVASIVWAIGFDYMSDMKNLQLILEQML